MDIVTEVVCKHGRTLASIRVNTGDTQQALWTETERNIKSDKMAHRHTQQGDQPRCTAATLGPCAYVYI